MSTPIQRRAQAAAARAAAAGRSPTVGVGGNPMPQGGLTGGGHRPGPGVTAVNTQANATGAPAPGSFGPGNNLINKQLPGVNASTGALSGALNDLKGFSFRPGRSARQATNMTLRGARTLFNAPDRGELARRTFSQIRSESEPGFQLALRDVGRRAAQFGRLGAGMTTSELGDVASIRERDLANAAERLSLGAADQEMADRLARVGALTGVTSTLGGQDLAGQGLNLQARTAGGTLASALDSLRTSTALANRGFLGQERAFQHGLEREALSDRINQRLLEEDLQGRAHGRQMDRVRTSADIGFGSNPAGVESQVAGIHANRGASQTQSAVDLARQLAAARARDQAPTNVPTTVGRSPFYRRPLTQEELS